MPVDQQQTREYVTATVAKDIIQMVRAISGHTGESMQDVYDRLLRQPATRELRKLAEKIAGRDLGGES